MWLQNWLPTVHTFWHQYKATTKLSRAFKILRGLQEHIAIVSFARCDWIINPVYYPSLVFLALTPKQKRAASSGSKSKIYRAQVYLRTARVVHTEIKTAKKDHGRNGGKAESRAIAMKHTPCKKKQCSAQYRALGKRVSFTSHTTTPIKKPRTDDWRKRVSLLFYIQLLCEAHPCADKKNRIYLSPRNIRRTL